MKRGTLKLAISNIGGQLIFIVTTPYLTNKFGADGFGIFAISYSLVSLIGNLSALRVEALITHSREDVAKKLFSISLLLAFIVPFAISIPWLIFGENIDLTNRIPKSYVYLVIAGSVFQGWANASYAFALRGTNFRYLMTFRVINFIPIVILGIFWDHNSPIGLIIGITVSSLVQFLVLLKALEIKIIFSKIFPLERVVLNEILSAIKYIFPASGIDIISQQLPILIISKYFGLDIVAFYSLATRFVNLPLSAIGLAASNTFHKKFSNAININRRFYIIYYWKRLFIISLLVYLVMAAFSPFLFEQIYGDKWSAAGDYLRYLAIAAAINLIFSPTSIAFIVLNERKIPLIASISAFVYRASAFIIGAYYQSIEIALILFCIMESIQILFTNNYLLKILR